MDREREEARAKTDAAMDRTRVELKNEVRRGMDLLREYRDEVREKLVLVAAEAREATKDVAETRRTEGTRRALSKAVKRARAISAGN